MRWCWKDDLEIINWSHWIYNGTVRKATHNNSNFLGMSRVSISKFHSGLVWSKHRKMWHAIFDCNIWSYVFMKQHSRECIKFEGGATTSQLWIICMSTSRRSSSCSECNKYRVWSISSSSIDLMIVSSGSWTDSELNSTKTFEGWISISPLSMSWWLSLPMIAETTELVFGVLELKWAAGSWLFYYIGGLFGPSPWWALNWFICLLRLGRSNLGPQMIQALDLCPILPQHSQILFCLMWRASITVWRDYLSFSMEMKYQNDESAELKWSMLLEIQSSLGNDRFHDFLLLCRQQIFCCCQEIWWDLSYWSQLILLVYHSLTMPSYSWRNVL